LATIIVILAQTGVTSFFIVVIGVSHTARI